MLYWEDAFLLCGRSACHQEERADRQILLIWTGTVPEAATSSGEAVAAREERLESSAVTREVMRWNRDEAILDQAHRGTIGFGRTDL